MTRTDELPLRLLMKRSKADFFTRRVLQRWFRGEITTDVAVEMLQPGEVQRIVGTWRNSGAND